MGEPANNSLTTGIAGSETKIPGQVTLPGMEENLGYDSAALDPWKELFCLAYVGPPAVPAYQAYMTVKPRVSQRTAEVESSKLLSLPEIKARVVEIQQELQRRWFVAANDIQEYHGRVMKTDRRKFFRPDGSRIPIHELPDDLAAIVDLDACHSKDSGIVLLPVVASRQKSADAVSRMLGLDKTKMELTGKDGGALETNASVTFYIPANGRD